MRKKKLLGFLLALGCFMTGSIAFSSCTMDGATSDTEVIGTEWKKALAFDYTHYQIDASFTPANDVAVAWEAGTKKDGDVMCVQVVAEGDDEDYDYVAYAARVGNDYKGYNQDEAGTWLETTQEKTVYDQFHASAIIGSVLKGAAYLDFTYNMMQYAYSYTKTLPNVGDAAIYTLKFLDKRIVGMDIEVKAAIPLTLMGREIALEQGVLSVTFAYENEEVILPSIDSPNDPNGEVTVEEWCSALALYDEENVQVVVMENNVSLGQFLKDGDIIYCLEERGDFGANDESYLQINEKGEILRDYYKDETGTWYVTEYDDLHAPGNGLGIFFNYFADADIYSRFTYDKKEGVYSFTGKGFFGSSRPSDDTENESDATTTISIRFENKQLVEIIIETSTPTQMQKIVCKYTYYALNVTLPVPYEGDGILTETEWEEALDLMAFENVKMQTTTSDGLPVELVKDGKIVYICLVNDDGGTQEVYFEKDGDVYKKFYQNLETGAWTEEECSVEEYESYVPLNLNNAFSYADFTYDERIGGYLYTATNDKILKFSDKQLQYILDETGAVIASFDYDAIELTLPTV